MKKTNNPSQFFDRSRRSFCKTASCATMGLMAAPTLLANAFNGYNSSGMGLLNSDYKPYKPLNVQPIIYSGTNFLELRPTEQKSQKAKTEITSLPGTDLGKEHLSKISKGATGWLNLLPAQLITPEYWNKKMSLDANKNVDCFLVIPITGGTQELIQYLTEFDEIPSVFYLPEGGLPHSLFNGYGAVPNKNKFAAIDEVDVKRYLKTFYTLKRLRESTVMCFGGVSWSAADTHEDLKDLSDVFGITFKKMSIKDLHQLTEQMDEKYVKQRSKLLKGNATKLENVGDVDFMQASALSLAMQQVVVEHKADAATVDCCKMLDEGGVAPCIPLGDLDTAGIPTGCEGDMNCLMGKMMLSYLSDTPTFMGNLGPFNKERNSFTIWHHSAPSNFFKGGKYSLGSYSERGVYFISDVDYPQPVTVAKISKDLKKATIVEGKVINSSDYGHATGLEIETRDLELFVEKHLLGNHHVVALGDYGKEMETVFDALGIEASRI